MTRLALLLCLIAGPALGAPPSGLVTQTGPASLTAAQAAAAAPVQSVNGNKGAVTLPIYQRQVSSALAVSTTDGTLTWTFPTAFGNMPTCWPSLAATSTGYTFDYPEQTAIGLTSVSYLVTAHPKQISIASLALPVLLQITPNGPPAGTTLTLSCIAPL